MKNHFKNISLVALFLIALSTIGAAQANSTLQNNSKQNLGLVTVYQTEGQPVYVPAPGPGTFPIPVTSAITVVVINGYGTVQGSKNTVTLPNGAKVSVTVTGGNIVVTDQTIMN